MKSGKKSALIKKGEKKIPNTLCARRKPAISSFTNMKIVKNIGSKKVTLSASHSLTCQPLLSYEAF
jgi:hypothetical protein